MVYYMTQRPPMIGAMPKEGLVSWMAFDDDFKKEFVKEIGCGAYAKLTYDRVLTEQEISDYELTPAYREVRLTNPELLKLIKLAYRSALDADGDEGDELYALWKKLRDAI